MTHGWEQVGRMGEIISATVQCIRFQCRSVTLKVKQLRWKLFFAK